MKPAQFSYHAPKTIDEALALLARVAPDDGRVLAVGGSGNIKGSLYASLILGVLDVAGKYFLPQVGAFVIYAVMALVLVFRPYGLISPAQPRKI